MTQWRLRTPSPGKHLAALALAALVIASPVAASGDSPEPLRTQDRRLLALAEPILARNVSLCDRTMPDLGVALESVDQYPRDSAPEFAAPVGFAVVLPGSAAARAGIAVNDGLIAIDGKLIAKRPGLASLHLRDSAFMDLAEHPSGAPLVLEIAHAGPRRFVTIAAQQKCRAMVEVIDSESSMKASSADQIVQIGYGLLTRANDEQVSVILAHELAHSILHHRDRLSAADVDKGLLGEFGRNRRLNLQAEKEADRLSVHLLANAGVDPRTAAGFWRSRLGRQLSGGIFHDRMHLSAKDRAALLDSEIARIAAGSPSYPADLMALRNQPMR
jgi:hypothetical protein